MIIQPQKKKSWKDVGKQQKFILPYETKNNYTFFHILWWYLQFTAVAIQSKEE